MVTIINAGRVTQGKQYLELAGLSTDDKPVAGLLNGSLFHEIDTTKIYAFNEEGDEGEEWVMQVQLTEPEDDTRSLSMAASPSVVRPGLQLTQDLQTREVQEELDDPEIAEEELDEQTEEPEEQTEESEGEDE